MSLLKNLTDLFIILHISLLIEPQTITQLQTFVLKTIHSSICCTGMFK